MEKTYNLTEKEIHTLETIIFSQIMIATLTGNHERAGPDEVHKAVMAYINKKY